MGLRSINADKYAEDLVLLHNVASEPGLRTLCQRTGLSTLGVTALEIDLIHSALGISVVAPVVMTVGGGGGGGGVAATAEQVGPSLRRHEWVDSKRSLSVIAFFVVFSCLSSVILTFSLLC